ncbi:tRNA (cytosine(38)-C(5))-methyltransferase-like isoform X2 [Takifugu rubripes]|uniref:tRNA (cytosine(38)-C(5))-methyltransferase-like isoform X2 n=1 Tax=Takifugu rubripes TaxID=31033 RepID=UPI001145D295|nr:tRNA (cytosine(38)-C(5))-methyltransferase-like isoform X2 [Takifugu rubripes]
MRVLELYSGIGGMHYALIESNLSYQVVAAVDINTTANQVYTHNFPNTALLNKTIEGITLEEFNKLSFDMILMSPPCQPFTRIGLQRDLDDPRTKSFLHIVDLLPRLSKAPLYILLENVKGFEKSAAREYLVKTLRECQYTVQEMMVSPTHVGIPNSRLRYYLMAKRSAQQKSDAQTGQEAPVSFHPTFQNLSPTTDELQELQIQAFLEPQEDVHEPQHLLPPKTLLRYAQLLDIVRPSCRRSVCFTKGYRKYVEGTGSVLQCCLDTSVEDVFPSLDQCSEEEKVQRLLDLKLRYFTPREVANLMGFPQSFTFPESVSTKQQYRLLGNSLNVVVVAKLLQLLVTPELQHKDGRPH